VVTTIDYCLESRNGLDREIVGAFGGRRRAGDEPRDEHEHEQRFPPHSAAPYSVRSCNIIIHPQVSFARTPGDGRESTCATMP
jgi:hypothetical protein